MSEIGKILRDLRESAGLSRSKLGAASGVNWEMIRRYEVGESAPWKPLEKTLDALGYELEVVSK